jgi:tetratricopeptide (TPR) repeat protein
MSSNLGENLIFLISQQRAGSTLLQRILFCHPKIHTTSEPWIMLHPIYAIKRSGYYSEYDSSLTRKTLDDFLSNIKGGEETYVRAIREAGLILYRGVLEGSRKVFFLDKTPRYYFIIRELYRVFPNAKFIFLLRNPIAVLSSILETRVKGKWQMLSRYKSDLLKAPKLIVEGIEHLKDDAIVVHYEDLVKEPEQTIRLLCESLKIEYHASMLEYAQKPAPKGKFGDPVRINQHAKPTDAYVDKWTKQLDTTPLKLLAAKYLNYLGSDVLSQMGYSLEKTCWKLNKIKSITAVNDKKTAQVMLEALGLTKDPNILCSFSNHNYNGINSKAHTSHLATSRQPKYTESLNAHGEKLYLNGKYNDAFSVFTQALKLDPSSPCIHNNLGVMYWQIGKTKQAIEHFKKALLADPEYRQTIINYGNILSVLQRIDEAQQLYCDYLDNNNHDQEILLLLEKIRSSETYDSPKENILNHNKMCDRSINIQSYSSKKKITLAHIINPVRTSTLSDLYTAQPITFESMCRAQKNTGNELELSLYVACYPEDESLVPGYFTITRPLDRSVLDVGSFLKKRKLPLLKDILDRLYEASDADYFIYTNIDIALMPYFYTAVKKFIELGYNAFVINRRTISLNFTKPDYLPLMYSQAGEKHPGYDCFVFRRDIYPRYKLGNACIGINWIGRVLIANLMCYTTNFKEFKDEHLTFHIGNDKSWKREEFNDYRLHNELECYKILKALEKETGSFNRDNPPGSFLSELENIFGSQACQTTYKTALESVK